MSDYFFWKWGRQLHDIIQQLCNMATDNIKLKNSYDQRNKSPQKHFPLPNTVCTRTINQGDVWQREALDG